MEPGLAENPGLLRTVHLEDFLPDWQVREPENPCLAALAPLVWPEKQLRQQAPQLWQTVQQAGASELRASLSDILLFWLVERFK